jgi:ATP-dependent Clp endopeptidase proteolytic subunit ClpP
MAIIDLEQLLRTALAQQRELEEEGVLFLGDIDDAAAEHFSRQLLTLAVRHSNAGTDQPITVYINSGGGSVGAGLAMMEMIYKMRDQYKVTVNTIVTGFAYSMGAIVFQAGNTRLMGTYSTLMLHSPQWYLSGSDQKIFNDYARLANHYKNLVANLFACRSGKHDVAWWEDYIYSGRDRFLTALECIDLGLCDTLYGTALPCPPPAIDDKNRSGLGE